MGARTDEEIPPLPVPTLICEIKCFIQQKYFLISLCNEILKFVYKQIMLCYKKNQTLNEKLCDISYSCSATHGFCNQTFILVL